MKSEKPKTLIIIEKTEKVIRSCITIEQLEMAFNYVANAAKYLSAPNCTKLYNLIIIRREIIDNAPVVERHTR